MNRAFSIYLDLIRFGAACLVYLWHSNNRLLVKDILPASNYGHSSVTVFFVLSGFVIAYVTDTKEGNWVDYSASRVSRVYSVALPALLLTPLLDAVGRSLYPQLYDSPWDQMAVRFAGCAAMLNEAWFISITYFSNTPYWSIAFECWYYVLFGLLMFLPGRLRYLAAAGVLLLLGPKLLLLLPVWSAGVLLYRWRWLTERSAAFSWCLVVVSLVGVFELHAMDFYTEWGNRLEQLIGNRLYIELTFAHFFPTDYLLGALVFCNFAGMRNIASTFAPLLLRIEAPVRRLAGYTFTLYLLHQPLFLFWTAVLRGDPHGHVFWVEVTVLTGGSVVLISGLTEQRRPAFRRILLRSMRRAAPAASSV